MKLTIPDAFGRVSMSAGAPRSRSSRASAPVAFSVSGCPAPSRLRDNGGEVRDLSRPSQTPAGVCRPPARKGWVIFFFCARPPSRRRTVCKP